MTDLYIYRSELKGSLLLNWQYLDLESHPLDWVWVLHATRMAHAADSQLLAQNVDRGLRWVQADSTWSSSGNLGAIGILCRSLYEERCPDWDEIAARLAQRALQLTSRDQVKFSWLNNPDIVYGIVVGGKTQFSADLCNWFKDHCLRNTQGGNWRRRMLFSAACVELGEEVEQLSPESVDLSLDELPCALWFAETYPASIKDDARRGLWTLLADVKEQVLLEPAGEVPRVGLYEASPVDIAMLLLAVVSRTQAIDPIALFRSIPLHPRVRQASESLFLKGEYVNAVLEAAKAIIDEIKHRANHPTDPKGKPLDGTTLVQQVFSLGNPILKFNALSTQSEKDEHRGLTLIAEGIVAAIRNPKGHDPKDKITLTPEEALDQLVVISYIYKRVDSTCT